MAASPASRSQATSCLLLLGSALLLIRSMTAFLPAPLSQPAEAVALLRGSGQASAALLAGAMTGVVPTPAQAYSETELNQFGLVFALFTLGFFIAGLFRMLTVGRL
eukprot:TRINITY_DN8315_c0_g2_i1.p1 TRINITY_DN8315_c0_g2~~TRINITY_DN8315_c0_g2_i1.p1  ORF type:complete len:106 (-),score=23.25 TRINITY_DN8315_c0_g2_i1:206-523(-)